MAYGALGRQDMVGMTRSRDGDCEVDRGGGDLCAAF